MGAPPNAQFQQPPPARCLDLTRLISRVGRGPWTGVDRVEAAYLVALLAEPVPLFAIARTALGHVLLSREGVEAIAARLLGEQEWGRRDLLARFTAMRMPDPEAARARHRAESDLRRYAMARTLRKGRGLRRLVKRHLPPGTVWINTGHSNLSPRVFRAFHALPGGRAHVLIHDMIPLDFPQYQRPGTVESFRARMKAVAAGADLVIYNSAQSQRDAERHFTRWGRVPQGIVAHLGVVPPVPDTELPATRIDFTRPYFVTIGTIEPRKNHALLLDVWDELEVMSAPEAMPQLVIIGGRGWNNDAVFDRLGNSPLRGRDIHELNGLGDSEMFALTAGANAALFPTLAEGFGLPQCEAAALGVPVVVNDLPIFREVLGEIPIYADGMDMYSWLTIIRHLARKNRAEHPRDQGSQAAFTPPGWQGHFNLVLKLM